MIAAGAAILDYRDDRAFCLHLVNLPLVLILALSLKPCFQTNAPPAFRSSSSWFFIYLLRSTEFNGGCLHGHGWGVISWSRDKLSYQ